MALQIRRGPTADRMSYTPVVGELIWDTTTNSLYIGNGTTAGGLPAGTLTTQDVREVASSMLVNGTHQNITFTYNNTTGRINSTFNLSSFDGTITAAGFIGSHYANDSTLLLNALTGAVNLIGTVKGPVIPSTDSAYDLGSASYRFRDLYLSGSSIKLGNATITSTGSAVNLPAGSTINGSVIGTGSGAGVEAGMNYNINIVGDDSTLIINARTKSISAASLSVVNPVSLPAGSTLNGSAIALASGSVINLGTGSTLNGTAFGFRVSGEDSTLVSINNGDLLQFRGDQGIQVSSQAGKIINISADITAVRPSLRNDSTPAYIPFVGETGQPSYIGTNTSLRFTSSTGTLETPAIIATDSINCPSIGTTDLLTQTVSSNGPLILTSTLNDGSANSRLVSIGTATVDGRFQITNNTYSSTLSLVNIVQAHATADARNFQFNRAKGTSAVPTVVASGDDIADIAFAGYDGAAYQVRATISSTVDGAVSAGVVPTKIEFLTGTTSTGVAVSIGSNRQTTFSGAIKLVVYADATARDAAIATPTAGMMVFNTTSTKFQGYTGAAWVDLN
jgi:hypothetical protein